jgi:zinc and cadmium transporter
VAALAHFSRPCETSTGISYSGLMLLPLLITLFAFAGVFAGVYLGTSRHLSPQVVAVGGGLLFGTSLFWVFPEMVGSAGWLYAILLLALGVSLLWLVDTFVFSICPSCSHTHDHHDCHKPPLHGFAAPLLAATAIHSLLDGWSVRLLAGDSIASWAVPVGLALHKIPEGLAIGLISRKSMSSAWKAAVAALLVESFTLLGAWIEPAANRAGALRFGPFWTTSVLGLVAGSFLFLGYHTIHRGRHEFGVVRAFGLTVALVASAALLHWQFSGV